MNHQFLEAWTRCPLSEPPFVLPGDEAITGKKPGFVVHRSLAEYASSEPFLSERDRMLHLGLKPIPFVGRICDARVYLLMLNPGLSAVDYLAEWHTPSYAVVLADNLKGTRPFIFLDPEFAWHSGFTYWHRKLAAVMRALSSATGLTQSQVLRRLACSICLIQLLPYHSAAFGVSRKLLQSLRSPGLAKRFVAEVIMPRAQAGDALVVVARHATYWEVPPCRGVVRYEGSEARAAHLTPNSQGGARIIDALMPGMRVASEVTGGHVEEPDLTRSTLVAL